jgi:hypothetical protein
MAMVPARALVLEASFGSVQQRREDFIVRARTPGRSDGVLLAFSPAEARRVDKCRVDAAAPPKEVAS